MGFIGLILCIVAFFVKKSNRNAAKKWMNGALVFYSLGVLLMLIRISTPKYYANGWTIIVPIVILMLMIVARLKLEESGAKKSTVMTGVDESDKTINYKKLTNEIFDVSMEFSQYAGDSMEIGDVLYPIKTIGGITIPSSGIALYGYAVILLREKMHQIYTDKVEFESEDNVMIEAFARKLKIPVSAFSKIIDRNGSKKEWRKLLERVGDTTLVNEYVDEVKVAINRATRGVTAPIRGIGELGDFEDMTQEDSDDEFDDGL